MLKRFLIVVIITASTTLPVMADQLGPSTTNNVSGSDSTTSGILQPASPSSLQTTGTVSGGATTQSNDTTSLQPAGSSSNYALTPLLSGAADGPIQGSSPASSSPLGGILLIVVALCLIFSAVMTFRISKTLEQQSKPKAEAEPAHQDDEPTPEPTQEAEKQA